MLSILFVLHNIIIEESRLYRHITLFLLIFFKLKLKIKFWKYNTNNKYKLESVFY